MTDQEKEKPLTAAEHLELAFQNVFSPNIILTNRNNSNGRSNKGEFEPSSPRRMKAVRERARELQKKHDLPYHIAMRRAGGEIAKSARDGTR